MTGNGPTVPSIHFDMVANILGKSDAYSSKSLSYPRVPHVRLALVALIYGRLSLNKSS